MTIFSGVTASGARIALGSLAFMLGLATAAIGQHAVPDFRVTVRGFEAADFLARLALYMDMRHDLEIGLPPLLVTDRVAEIHRAERLLASRIRSTRGPAEGTLFTAPIAREIRRALELGLTMTSVAVILDENPGEFAYRINGEYPKSRRRASMPGRALAILPLLPADVQYRFVGDHLILHDTRANIILDRMGCVFTRSLAR